jgi:hypothetical protein
MSELKRVTVYLEPELHRALKYRSAEVSRSVSDLVNSFVKGGLAGYSDVSATADNPAHAAIAQVGQISPQPSSAEKNEEENPLWL